MAKCGNALVAKSSIAQVMHETRLPPVVYFPRDSIPAGLLQPSKRRTFCPFKGTASYFDLHIDGGVRENAAWSYRSALPEAKDVEGYIAFMPSATVFAAHHNGEVSRTRVALLPTAQHDKVHDLAYD